MKKKICTETKSGRVYTETKSGRVYTEFDAKVMARPSTVYRDILDQTWLTEEQALRASIVEMRARAVDCLVDSYLACVSSGDDKSIRGFAKYLVDLSTLTLEVISPVDKARKHLLELPNRILGKLV